MSQFFSPKTPEFPLTLLRTISLPVTISPFPSPCPHFFLVHLNHTDSLKTVKPACCYLNFEIKVGIFAFDWRYMTLPVNFQFVILSFYK